MILVDISQTLISNILISVNSYPEINEEVIRYMVLRSIGSYKRKFSEEYGEMIICADSKPSWRKEIFPFYKANRDKTLLTSKVDWKRINECITMMIDELQEYFPYRVVKAAKAEGDDVIAILVYENSLEVINNSNKILIVSADKDFSQLQKFPNVEQYDPVFTKKKIVQNDPHKFLKEHIIKGDKGDGIPNIMSKDDCIVMGVRQSPVFEKKLEGWVGEELENFCTDEMIRNYKRNERLIDLSFIPEEIKNNILLSYNSQKGKSRNKILPYFVKNKLSKLMKDIGDY